ncbi:MAG: CDP-diacylglycerol--glycerol-3-phosphate 3-phosphatidyltransferase [Bacteriovoracaceae bacterium]|nr:CDP-diacylglycerol--glycerol-3-phosphate 3-phosphatidyltransferase [Bacteroidota bacterium]
MLTIPISPPNQLTLLRIALTPVFLYYLFSADPVHKQIALGIFVLAAITDWYDGYVARRWGFITRWGKFLDPLADKILTSAAFISFIYIGYAEAWMVWVIVVRDFLMTFLRAYGEWKGKSINTSGFAKTKTFFQLVVIYLFLLEYIVRTDSNLNIQFGWLFDIVASPMIMFVLMFITTILTAITGILYLIYNKKIIFEIFTNQSDGTATEQH